MSDEEYTKLAQVLISKLEQEGGKQYLDEETVCREIKFFDIMLQILGYKK